MDRFNPAGQNEAIRFDACLDRLEKAAGQHLGLYHFHAECAVQSQRYWPKPMLERAKANRDTHKGYYRAIQRRIRKLVNRGTL